MTEKKLSVVQRVKEKKKGTKEQNKKLKRK